MNDFQVGDVVGRKSYGADVSFKIIDISKSDKRGPVYVLKGIWSRLEADCSEDDLIKQDARTLLSMKEREITAVKRHAMSRDAMRGLPFFLRLRTKPGVILQLDSSKDMLDSCLDYYKELGVKAYGKVESESNQPFVVRNLLEKYNPDILILTGHDGLKKDIGVSDSLDNYRNSRYYVQSVKQARKYEADFDRLFIFAGACQSYYEAIIEAGANYGSSPERVNIRALDPAIVSRKFAMTDSRKMLSPDDVVKLTITGKQGVWGINCKGHMKMG